MTKSRHCLSMYSNARPRQGFQCMSMRSLQKLPMSMGSRGCRDKS